MSTIFSYHFQNTFYWIQFRTIWWQEEKRDSLPVFMKPRFEKQSMVISRIIQNNNKSFLFTATFYNHLNELFESLGIKNRGHVIYQFSRGYIYSAKERHVFLCRSVQHNRILFFRRYPHCTARTMLLEVAFIQAPDFIHRIFCQLSKFF